MRIGPPCLDGSNLSTSSGALHAPPRFPPPHCGAAARQRRRAAAAASYSVLLGSESDGVHAGCSFSLCAKRPKRDHALRLPEIISGAAAATPLLLSNARSFFRPADVMMDP